jgi:hypothetical protein
MAADGHPTKKPAMPTKHGGRKLVVDVETNTRQESALTVDEARAMAADIHAQLATLRPKWEASGDLHALLGGLIFCERQLPEWLFKGLMQNLLQQLNNPHATRFLAVCYAHDVLGMTMDESYDWASANVTDPRARGRRDTMMKSYQEIRRHVGKDNRIRRRPPRQAF